MVNFLLDADETILDFVRSSEESLAHTMRAFGLPYGKEMYAAYKRINDGLWREYERGEIDKKSLMRERFSRFFASLGIEADPDAANAMYFETLCRTGYLLAGADAFLHALKERGRIFLVTNGTPAAQYGRLASLGLENFFDGVYISDEIGYKKPDARFFGVQKYTHFAVTERAPVARYFILSVESKIVKVSALAQYQRFAFREQFQRAVQGRRIAVYVKLRVQLHERGKIARKQRFGTRFRRPRESKRRNRDDRRRQNFDCLLYHFDLLIVFAAFQPLSFVNRSATSSISNSPYPLR